MIKLETFRKRHTMYSTVQLGSMGAELADITELPTGCVTHQIAGIDQLEKIPPQLQLGHPLMDTKPERKLIFNVTKPIEHGIMKEYPPNLHVRSMGVEIQLKNFKTENTSTVKYTSDIEELKPSPMYSCIVNYNPLFINKITGINKQVTQINYVLQNLINMIGHLPDRQHYIPIPLNGIPYEKNKFLRAFKKIDKASIIYPEQHIYLILMHFYAWLDLDSKSSMFDILPESIQDNITFAFTREDKVLFYNLKDLRTMRGTANTTLVKVFNQINRVSELQSEVLAIESAPEGLLAIDESLTQNRTGVAEMPNVFEQIDAQKEALKARDDKVIADINASMDMTPAQKLRWIDKANAYKDIEVDGVKVSEILKPKDNRLNDNEIDFLDDITDPTMKASKITNFDQQYVENHMERHMLLTLSSFCKAGMVLTKCEKVPLVDKMNRLVQYRVQYTEIGGKTHSMRFDLPIVDKNGRCFVNGNYKTMTKQRVNLPINKVSDVRVTLNSNYNKLVVQLRSKPRSTIHSQLSNIINDKNLACTYMNSDTRDLMVSKDYTEISRKYGSIKTPKCTFTFDHPNRLKKAHKEAEKLEKLYKGVYIGHTGTVIFFAQLNGNVVVHDIRSKEVAHSDLLAILGDYMGNSLKPTGDYASVNLLNKHLPVVFLLAYKFGLDHMLKYMNVDYKLLDKGERISDAKPTDMIIQFKDKKLIIGRTPTVVRLMFGGLTSLKLKDIYYEAMNNEDAYYEILDTMGLSLNYIRGINGFFDLFVDPMTEEVLQQIKEPTNLKDLLIRAVLLLSTDDHAPSAAASNFRFRSYERYPGMVYNTMARALHAYKYKGLGAGNKFSITPFEVKSKVMKDPLLDNTGFVNPIKEIKDQTHFNYLGEGGRTKETFMIKDRSHPQDNTGIVCESNIDSGAVGTSAYTSANPSMVNTNGLTKHVTDYKAIGTAGVGSVTTTLFAGLICDDPKRINFNNTQVSSYVGTRVTEMSRYRTGYEKILPHRTSAEFSYTANENGQVLEVNDKLKLIKIKYTKSKTTEVLEYGEQSKNNTANGFYTTQNIVPHPKVKKGYKFRKGDSLVYNKDFFHIDPMSGRPETTIGINANIAFLENDNTTEDSSAITVELADKLQFKPAYMTEVTLDANDTIHKFMHVGESCKGTEPIMVFDQSDLAENMAGGDGDLAEVLTNFNNTAPKAKHTGVITKIETVYKGELSKMSKSIKNIINKYNSIEDAKHRFSAGTIDELAYPPSGPITVTDKVGPTIITDDTVIIRFYITEVNDMAVGSKLVVSSSLKSVVGRILPPITSDSGIVVDGLMGGLSISNRIVLSPVLHGGVCRVLIDLEKYVKEASSKNAVVTKIVEIMDILDPSGTNTARYKNMFKGFSAAQYKAYIGLLKKGELQIYLDAPNGVIKLTMPNIFKAAAKLGTKIFERIWLTDAVTGREYLTNEKYAILNVSIRRLQQFIDKKLRIPNSDMKVDAATNQVVAEDNASNISNPEAQVMQAKGLQKTLVELMKVRGGDAASYAEARRQMEGTGELSLETSIVEGSHARSSVMLDSLLRGLNLDSNVAE